MNYYQDKVAIVTGGASGIGRSICQQLAKGGAGAITVADIDIQGAQRVADSINASGGCARVASLDVTSAADVEKLVVDVSAADGRLDLIFNNAGVAMCGEVRDMGLQDWRDLFGVNLWGVIYGTTAAYRVMLKQGNGQIVNTASLGGLTIEPMATAYVASKYAVVGLSLNLRAEAADLGVRVNVFCPGLVQTRALDSAMYFGIRKQDAMDEMSFMQGASAEDSVRSLLRGVECNQAIITDSTLTRVFWWLYRLNPSSLNLFIRKGIHDMRALRLETVY
jgi:NAD(P)-dependent dehydrogenase (short-subunit alcohol dehydrogenase family)